MGLREYNAKRNFQKTLEPSGSGSGAKDQKQRLLFVIQKHAASHLHYDFRLEMEGVLKSWAVPKGLPLIRGERRLAVEVEDHPFDYRDFEGTIPPGNYGAGTVMVWDTGTYEMVRDEPLASLKRGELKLRLHGKKLKGEWHLVRMKPRDPDAKPQWLIFKSGEDHKPLSPRIQDRSVISKRTMDEITSAADRQWQSNRRRDELPRVPDQASPSKKKPAQNNPTVNTRQKAVKSLAPAEPPTLAEPDVRINVERLPKASAEFIEPMKAALVEHLPKGPQWIYELKFDGVRALGIKDGSKVRLISRAAKDLGSKYALVLEALKKLPAKSAVLDGEVVAIDESGRSSFQLLQSYQMPSGKKPPLIYYAFDLLQLDGKDLCGLPLLQRKAAALALTERVSPIIKFSAGIKADSEKVMKEMQARGLEGLIAKLKDSKYEPGRRSGKWVKFKWTNEQEFVIGGYTEPQGARSHFGALLVGYYEANKLLFAAKVGTGYDEKTLTNLFQRFQKLVRKDCPFANLPERPSAGGRGFGRSQMRLCTWIEPKLVCQVRFSEWTRDHHLRQPAFLGLREDKNPKEVVREIPKG
jgi:bifunctional non-homologous end joining protein LigD